MLAIVNVLMLVLNAIFLVSIITSDPVKPTPPKATQQSQQYQRSADPVIVNNNDEIIELIADMKSEFATLLAQRENKPVESQENISTVCIAYQIHLRSGNHFWTYINTTTGKPYFCTPHNRKTEIPTIDVDPLPQEFREDLIEP